MIKAAIIGGAGYTAGELIRILINHKEVELTQIISQSNTDKPLHAVHQDLVGEVDIHFTKKLTEQVDVVFLCTGHGKSQGFFNENEVSSEVKIIDLSNDFRLNADAKVGDRQFIYGLPELNYDNIKSANSIANPGCFATAIQLALLPLASKGLIKNDVHVNAITGSTGAGQSPSATTHFSWRNNNVSIYKAFKHQHLGEIGESIDQLQPGFESDINFLPVRGNFTRGIFASAYTEVSESEDELKELYNSFYSKAAFTHVSESAIHLKQVVNTNKCLVNVEKHGKNVLVTSIIDNLLKGASGQAVQNMNIIFGLDEYEGLQLKSTYF